MTHSTVPYNDAMQIGLGFNTFNQELRNSAVRPAGNHEAVSDPPLYKRTAPEGADVDIGHDVVRTAKFVDRISQLTHCLQISAAAPIKSDFATTPFVDTNSFLESDINYLIQVRVKQSLAAPGLAEFEPIHNRTHADFTRIYGDSFIAGFVEGGEFNALISIKLSYRSEVNRVKQQLAAYLSFKPTTDLVKPVPIHGETNIAVSWRGGGDITIHEWTLESLKAVVAEFPGKAMKYPARIYAIIAKYSDLEAFSDASIKHTDYDKSGLYAVTLLDAYANYKLILHNICQTVRKVEQGEYALLATEEISEAAELLLEHDTPPNRLVPYKASIFGLDRAAKDCSSQMLKIVEEVTAVTEDPTIARSSTRLQQFLSPALFRMLLPVPPKTAYCPVALETPVRFRAHHSGKCMEYHYDGGVGSMRLHQYDAIENNPNQMFEIVRFSSKGFYVRHVQSGRFLTISARVGDRRVYLTFAHFPSVFTFGQQIDSTAVMIHLAEQPQFTLNLEGGSKNNGTELSVWAGGKGDNDKWYIKNFDDLSA